MFKDTTGIPAHTTTTKNHSNNGHSYGASDGNGNGHLPEDIVFQVKNLLQSGYKVGHNLPVNAFFGLNLG
ncbi:hypothetical protein [cyanobacterium endosymbiont of Epithemia clementina EcSB]|uniref:hypothetical protein n=1 Tax=cyanobacterium endosymbiont of Epithemia clementina EcSB TaxID=3034674 RepID=UPI002481934F|nr:hypothetical protein [cyanobacterium endosymbiont of Epithemia clementina EcSB]WGT67205.1 hypothetical protein P3F56_08280 [cyanobacterium endosymbiont of Epithemia clementina EcSB]